MLAEKLHSIASYNRLSILQFLKDHPADQQTIAEALGLKPSLVSHHLSILAEQNFVGYSRAGQHKTFYLNQLEVEQLLADIETFFRSAKDVQAE